MQCVAAVVLVALTQNSAHSCGMTGVKLRLERENPLTLLEFNYMILQAYDFLELFRRFKCTLQLGGSDQWGLSPPLNLPTRTHTLSLTHTH